jgi:mannose-6-phosphate isomerase-like protein (cupin superfamily)
MLSEIRGRGTPTTGLEMPRCATSKRPRLQPPTRSMRISEQNEPKDGDDEQPKRCVYRRRSRGRGRLHGGLPSYGEQRRYTSALRTEQVSFSWRRMLPKTGGRSSYGHRHPGQEEVYFVILGVVTFKIDDDVFRAGPQTAVRVGGDAFRSVHNDTDEEAQLLIFSPRLEQPPTETRDDFWAST